MTRSSFSPPIDAGVRASVLREALMSGNPLDVAIVGAGKSGEAAKALLLELGANVTMHDDKPERGAPIEADALASKDLVVLSPGVPRARVDLSKAIAKGIVLGEIEVASWFVDAPLVGITGTNGKSTTTALVAHLLEADGKAVFAGGNLGRPLAELALDRVRRTGRVDVAVVELSSYQLESIVLAQFVVAAWLNLTPDHVDRYKSLDDYARAKRRILERRSIDGTAVLNAHDPIVASIGADLSGRKRWFAADQRSELAHSTGTQALEGGLAARASESYDINNPAMVGAHNRANMAAAIECARLAGASRAGVQKGLKSFAGLPHRIEVVGKAKGATWYNDSKATNIDSAITAIRAIKGPKILIAGGRDKGAPWRPLVELARPDLRAVLAVGEATPIVLEAFAGACPVVEAHETVERATRRAAELARPGDHVLLSPACASLDQFTNYEARGDLFRRLVRELEVSS